MFGTSAMTEAPLDCSYPTAILSVKRSFVREILHGVIVASFALNFS